MQSLRSLLSAAVLVGAAASQTLVVPSAAAAADGNSSTSWPFDVAAGRFLYIYDSSHFTANGVTFPILITQIEWRANATTTSWTGSSVTSLQVDLSTAPIDYTAISTTWNANHGIDRATVYNGSWNIPSGSSTAGVPGPFYATCTFATPFLYDPTQGDLVIDTIHSGITVANTPTLDAVTTAGVANAKRVYSTTNPPAATATAWSGDLANVLRFTYTPASGLNANFQADVTSGPSPLTVNFADQSFTSAPGGVTSWAWDFDGDSVIDSTLQNPTFTYTTCGNFNVTLTVTDGMHSPSTLTKTAYIATDNIAASFTYTVIGPLLVQFTDTSTPAATAWAWDFDGDTIIDSTAQNPVWAFPSTVPTNVTLTATRLCKSNTVTQQVIAAQILQTNLAHNNSVGAPATLYFNLDILNPAGVRIDAFDTISSSVSAPFTVDIYMKLGTFAGFELNPAPWTQVATASGTTASAANQLALATLSKPWYLPQGSYGIAMRFVGMTPRYFGTGSTPIPPVGNGDLVLTPGSASLSTAGAFTGTNLNTPRQWCGILYYGTHNVTGLAGHGWFGPGCAGTAGRSNQSYVTAPTLGGTLSVDCNNMPFAIGVMVVGTSNTWSGLGPLPIDLGIVGAPGCPLRVSLDHTATVVGSGTSATWSMNLPSAPWLSGALFYNQLAVLDPAANAFGFVVGDAAGWVVGN
jgi:PKD repeat protein